VWESSQSAEADWCPRFPYKREGPRHFRSYAYNPVFKDRAELSYPKVRSVLVCSSLRSWHLAAPCFVRLGGGALRLRLHSVNLFARVCHPLPARLRLTNWHHGGPRCPGSVTAGAVVEEERPSTSRPREPSTASFFLPSSRRGRRLLGFSRRPRCPEASVRREGALDKPRVRICQMLSRAAGKIEPALGAANGRAE
jgi:hypothetical protein